MYFPIFGCHFGDPYFVIKFPLPTYISYKLIYTDIFSVNSEYYIVDFLYLFFICHKILDVINGN